MEPKRGDRVSLDAKKVGQPRRAGTVLGVTKGLSGPRYEIRWDDGSLSTISPASGILLVEGRSAAKPTAKAKAKAPKAKAKAKAKAPKAKAKAPKAKGGQKKKKSAKRRG